MTSLLFGEISRVSIRLQSYYRSVFFSKKRGFQTLSGAFAPQILLRPLKGLKHIYPTPLDSRFTIVYNTCFFISMHHSSYMEIKIVSHLILFCTLRKMQMDMKVQCRTSQDS